MEREELTLERAEELARELKVHPQAIRRLFERARRVLWNPGERSIEFVFPERARASNREGLL